jgi:predicted acetyltransferase
MIAIAKANMDDKPIIRNLLQLYLYDFSEFDMEDVDDHGLYEYYLYLDHYWTEEGRYPFLIRVEDNLAGFVFVRQVGITGSGENIYSIAEFFVMKKYRRTGVGKQVAHRLFDMFSGIWKVGQIEGNHPAQVFWRKNISEYTKNDFDEIREGDWDGPIQRFRSQ